LGNEMTGTESPPSYPEMRPTSLPICIGLGLWGICCCLVVNFSILTIKSEIRK